MKSIEIKAYGKINLSLDVLGTRPDGYHEVEMIMQQIMLHDFVIVSLFDLEKNKEHGGITLEMERENGQEDLPRMEDNLAYKAALLMKEEAKIQEKTKNVSGNQEARENKKDSKIHIKIVKNIPMAAGLAGGSADAAAVILGLNKLLKLELSLEGLYKIGERLGQDIPFCIMNQAYSNKELGFSMDKGSCAFAYGKGEKMDPLYGIKALLVLSKPNVGVSTAEVYKAMDKTKISKRPNTKKLIEILGGTGQNDQVKLEAIKTWGENVMEDYTLTKYKEANATKQAMENNMKKASQKGKVMMSGSGPTIFLITKDETEARKTYQALKNINKETFLTETVGTANQVK